MKKTICTIASMLFLLTASAQQYAAFKEGFIRDITPKGWLLEFLNRQKTGMTGHPEALSYPYNTCLWAGEIPRNGNYGQDWWRYEQTAYYTDGLLRLGYLLDDKELIEKGEAGIDYTLKHVQSSGRLGSSVINSLWPQAVFFRAMKAYAEYHDDSTIKTALRRNYLSMSKNDLTSGRRHILNLEGMLWTYGQTNLRTFLTLAQDAYKAGGFEMDAATSGSEDYVYMHGVTYSEMLKVPLLLYAYTGNEEYLKIAMTCERKLERDHVLPDGVLTSAEYTVGHDVDMAHETCDIIDYTWSLGYYLSVLGDAEWADRIERAVFNAGLGSITKDFRSLQYFSSLNQITCTGNSDNNFFKRGSTWMAYRPTHETECCAGNIHRLMPNFASRLWMRGNNNEVVAAMYSPSEFDFVMEGDSCHIAEETYYPFDGEINFRFTMKQSHEIPFMFRVPGWCKECSVLVNGTPANLACQSGTFVTLNRQFKDGDVVTLKLGMTPQITAAPDEQGYYVECGPLLYSYPVPEKKTEDTNVYSNMNGKVPENPDFKCWSFQPAGAFNYAMKTADQQLTLEVDREKLKSGAYPFDADDCPVSIQLDVQNFQWALEGNRYNPVTPCSHSITMLAGQKTVTLKPYGTTQLRLTVFPNAAEAGVKDLTDSLMNNPDFERLAANKYNYGGVEQKNTVPYGWRTMGTFTGAYSYGINHDAANLHGENVCWYRPCPMPSNFQLYQNISSSKIKPGTYRVSCLLWCQKGALGTCRLFANKNVQYYGKESDYAKNLVAGENATFAGHKGWDSGSPFHLEKMEVIVTVGAGESLQVGIKSSNVKTDGTLATSSSDASGWFKVDNFRIERIDDKEDGMHGVSAQVGTTSEGIYGLNGQRLAAMNEPGVYIVGGRKIAKGHCLK